MNFKQQIYIVGKEQFFNNYNHGQIVLENAKNINS